MRCKINYINLWHHSVDLYISFVATGKKLGLLHGTTQMSVINRKHNHVTWHLYSHAIKVSPSLTIIIISQLPAQHSHISESPSRITNCTPRPCIFLLDLQDHFYLQLVSHSRSCTADLQIDSYHYCVATSLLLYVIICSPYPEAETLMSTCSESSTFSISNPLFKLWIQGSD